MFVGWAPGEPQQWLATAHQLQPFTSLRTLQIHASTGIPRKDRCLVNVLRFLPMDVQGLCHTRAQLGLPHTGAAAPLLFCASACKLLQPFYVVQRFQSSHDTLVGNQTCACTTCLHAACWLQFPQTMMSVPNWDVRLYEVLPVCHLSQLSTCT